MIGWIVAGAVLVLAAVVILRLQSHLAQSRQEIEEQRLARHQVQEEMEQQRGNAELGQMLAELAPGLLNQLVAGHTLPPAVLDQLADYRRRVLDYDAAVQFCLQPVELMPGADEDDLERLMAHVSGARKRLFQARTALVEDELLQQLPTRLEQAFAGPARAEGLDRALAVVAGAGQYNQPIELGEVVRCLIQLTRVRNPQGPQLEADIGELPVLPPWPWLPPALARLLQLAMHGSNSEQVAKFEGSAADGKVVLSFSGARRTTGAKQDPDSVQAAIVDTGRRLDEHGLTLITNAPQQCGFTLSIPVPTGVPGAQ